MRPAAGPGGARAPLSVIVTTRDEEVNIAECLLSVQWAAEVLVVDSGSADRTLEIAAPLADRILSHPYESPARQKNWAIPQAAHAWVLILDADERVLPGLEEEIRRLLLRGPDADGYWIYRRNTFLGREMRHGGWGRDRVIRFFARDRARYPDVRVHEEMLVEGRVATLAGRLLHHSVRSFAAYAGKMERYSTWWALDKHQAGRRAGAGTVLAHTLGRFARMYILRGGFLDGGHGLLLALLASFSVYQKYAKLWEMSRGGTGAP